MEYIVLLLLFMFWDSGMICVTINYYVALEIALIPFFLMPYFQSNCNNNDGNQLKPMLLPFGRWGEKLRSPSSAV